nr:endonuclease/exonuclease/phosphatase family protein [Streptomyces sp. NBC_00857]
MRVRMPLFPRPTASGPAARPGLQRFLIGAAGVCLAAVSVIVGCRALGVDGVTPVPQLLAFLPWLLVPTAAALVLTALLRRRTGVVWALVVLAATGWFVRPYDAGSYGTEAIRATASTGTGSGAGARGPVVARIDVLTSNVEFGQATPALVTTIRREKPDLVFVQECDSVCVRLLTARIPHADYPYRNVVTSGVGEAKGSVILSALPLTDTEGIRGALGMPGSRAVIGGRTVQLQLVHPMPPLPGGVDIWRDELGVIRTYAAGRKDAPLILAGDFNATRDHAAFRDILDAGRLRDSSVGGGAGRTPSWPADAPRPLGAQIDHVLISDDFSVRDARFLDLADTDHRSLLVRLELHARG